MMTVSRRDGHAETQCKRDGVRNGGEYANHFGGPKDQRSRHGDRDRLKSVRRRIKHAARGKPRSGWEPTINEREAAELVRIQGRLMAEYGPSLGPDAVIRCIADAVGYFGGAPVRTYVMLLVERRAAAQLRKCGAPLSMSTVQTRCPRSLRRVRHLGSARGIHPGEGDDRGCAPNGSRSAGRVLRRQLRRRQRRRSDRRGTTSRTAYAPTAAAVPRRPPGLGGCVHRPSSWAGSPPGTCARRRWRQVR